MKHIFLYLLIFPNIVFSQKHDYIWISGDSNNPNTTLHGGMVIDFNQKPVNVKYNFRELNMFICNASICDSSGQLVAYTNGCHIAGADDNIIENGEMINPGYAWQVSCIQNADGYAAGIQSAIFLPLPKIDSVYFLFHKQIKLIQNPFSGYPDALMISVLDLKENNGKGRIVQKNVDVIRDTLAYGELIAAKHSNGSDWWIMTPRRYSNTFYTFKFTKDGITDTIQQTIGIKPAIQGEGYGQIVFSPDGTKIYRTNPFNPIMVYDFDRETGMLTGFDTISYTYGNTPVGEIGCAVSPNGRFLYLGARKNLYQLDLQASDISASQTLVAEWDGFASPFATLFQQLQLGPDCKIYGLAGGDTRYFHVIHNPDEPGLACNVEQRGLPLPTPSGASIPYFPNYNLGPIDNPGQPCTPTVSVSAGPVGAGAVVRVWPNPADQTLHVQYTSDQDAAGTLSLYNAVGQLVLQERVAAVSGGVVVSVGHLPEGIYYYFASGGYSGKVIIQH